MTRISVKRGTNNPPPNSSFLSRVTLSPRGNGGVFQISLRALRRPYLVNYVITSARRAAIFPPRRNHSSVETIRGAFPVPSPPNARDSRRPDDDGNEFYGIYNGDPDARRHHCGFFEAAAM